MSITIVGLSGKAGAGKDTIARAVFRPLGYAPWAFAFPLKVAGTGHGFSYQEVFQTKPPMARQWLQEYGARKRDMDPDFWVKQADAWIRTLHEAIGITKFVITDVRYRNEVDYTHSMGGKVIRIHHGHGLPYPLEGTLAAGHSSETDLDHGVEWDAVFYNHLSGNPGIHARMELEKQGIVPPWSALRG